jgi:hypothetical protein
MALGRLNYMQRNYLHLSLTVFKVEIGVDKLTRCQSPDTDQILAVIYCDYCRHTHWLKSCNNHFNSGDMFQSYNIIFRPTWWWNATSICLKNKKKVSSGIDPSGRYCITYWDPYTCYFYLVWEELPEQWKELVSVPIYEKGDKTDFCKPRNITLTCYIQNFIHHSSVYINSIHRQNLLGLSVWISL